MPTSPLPPPPGPWRPAAPGAPWVPPPPSFGRVLSDRFARFTLVSSVIVLLGAFGVLLWVRVEHRPPPGIPIALVAFPVVFANQLRTILSLQHRSDLTAGGDARRRRRQALSVDAVAGGVPRIARFAVLGLLVLLAVGWAAARAPYPEATPGRCDAVVEEHGERRCVDPVALDRYQAGSLAGAAVVVGVFALFHGVVALSELNRARTSRPGAPF